MKTSAAPSGCDFLRVVHALGMFNLRWRHRVGELIDVSSKVCVSRCVDLGLQRMPRGQYVAPSSTHHGKPWICRLSRSFCLT